MSDAPGTLPPTLTAGIGSRRARQRKLLLAFIALSVGLHLGLVAGWLLVNLIGDSKPTIDLDEASVKTRLVKLGKERPPDWLPRIDAAPAPPPPTKKHAPTKEKPVDDKPTPEAKDKPKSVEEALKNFDQKSESVSDIIKNRIGQPTDEGAKDGDKEGDALNGRLKAEYFDRVGATIRKKLDIASTISDEECLRLVAVLALKIDGDGTVTDAHVQKSSGSDRFDNDVITAAKRASPVPAPPPQMKDVAAAGFAFNVHCQRN
ncbi:MAG TPA: energy transducer TonB [Myxococcota bacterium]|jgi:TonB family protein